MSWDHLLPGVAMSDDEPRRLTPTEAVEDAVRELVERMTEFQAATAYWILNRNGMTCEKALAIRRKGVGTT